MPGPLDGRLFHMEDERGSIPRRGTIPKATIRTLWGSPLASTLVMQLLDKRPKIGSIPTRGTVFVVQ